jgi:hypothetical protein
MAAISAKANESMWRNVNEMAKKIIANHRKQAKWRKRRNETKPKMAKWRRRSVGIGGIAKA